MPAATDPAEVESFLPLRPVEFHVLLSLCRGERHGYGIMLDAEERTGGALVLQVGTLYRALRRMKQAGLIVDSNARPTDEDDERRNYYAVTALGRAVAQAEAQRLDALLRAAREGGVIDAAGR
ncbi:MAG: PadR family transcriptional regulator [Acidobacteriota bacterium]|jgi:DNA-binding PadR family transcriptional regulator